MHATTALPIVEVTQVGDARRLAATLGAQVGLDEVRLGNLGIVVTEMANNLVQHARGGVLLLRQLGSADGGGGVEVIAIDKAPGMADVDRCLVDGYSTAGTPGTGLGAISRQSDVFDIYSGPKGTAVMAQVWSPGERLDRPVRGAMGVGVVNVAMAGEEACGDSWTCARDGELRTYLVADGLGHGTLAAAAARLAVRTLTESDTIPPSEVLTRAHERLRSSRGAAVAVAQVDPRAGELRWASIGNVSGSILSAGRSIGLLSHNGIVGAEMRRVQQQTYAWPEDAVLIMASDGLSTLHADRYPGLVTRHPALIAGVLYRDFSRERDDATVLVAKRLA